MIRLNFLNRCKRLKHSLERKSVCSLPASVEDTEAVLDDVLARTGLTDLRALGWGSNWSLEVRWA